MAPKTQGSILVLVLIFTTIITFLVKIGFDVSILQTKMVSHFKENLAIKSRLEAKIIFIEKLLEEKYPEKFSGNITHLQFVPDTLSVDEKAGVDFYQIQVNHENNGQYYHAKSVVGVRRQSPDPTINELAISHSQESRSFDAIYFPGEQGKLQKINMINHLHSQEPLFSGELLGKPIVGRHPHGKGVLLYILTEHKILGLWDENDYFHPPFLIIEDAEILGHPLLWQGLLLVFAMNKESQCTLSVYDGFTGTFIRQEKMIYKGAISKQNRPHLKVLVAKPREKKRTVMASSKDGVGFCKIEIDYERLGRRVWGH